jgi:hypothetical protein
MAPEETPQRDLAASDSAMANRRTLSAVRPLLLFATAMAILIVAAIAAGEPALWWLVIFFAAIVAARMAYQPLSTNVRLLVWLMAFQFLGSSLLAPGDCNVWLFTMWRLYLGVDLYLFCRLYLFYKILRRPEPQLSWLMNGAIMTSPLWMAVVVTYLMENFGAFR